MPVIRNTIGIFTLILSEIIPAKGATIPWIIPTGRNTSPDCKRRIPK